MDWQPIETAPKDRVIALWDGSFQLGRWATFSDNGAWDEPLLYWQKDSVSFHKLNPTHWAPIPFGSRELEAKGDQNGLDY